MKRTIPVAKLAFIFSSITLPTTSTAIAQDTISVPALAEAAPCADCYSVLDIKLRTPCSGIEVPDGFQKTEQINHNMRNGGIETAPYPYQLVYTNESSDVQDRIWIHCTSPLIGGGVVTEVSRNVTYKSDSAKPYNDQLRNQIIQYHGATSSEDGRIIQFTLDRQLQPIENTNKMVDIFNRAPRDGGYYMSQGYGAILSYVVNTCSDGIKTCQFNLSAIDWAMLAEDAMLQERFVKNLGSPAALQEDIQTMITATADNVVFNLAENSPAPVPEALVDRDILGLKLGMSPDQVGQIITAEGYTLEKSERAVSAKVNGKEIASPAYVRRITGKIKDEAKINVIVVNFLSPLNGNSAYSINRYIEYLPASGPTTAETLALLSRKYNIDYGKSKNYEDCVLTTGDRDRPLERTIAKPESFVFLLDALDANSNSFISHYFSAGVEEDRSGRISGLGVALLNGRGYLKDRVDLRKAIKSFEEANSKHAVAPKL